jgi:hypothetical protein
MQPTFTTNVCGLKEPSMSVATTIQTTPAWQLRASVTPVRGDQHHLMVTSLVPTARRPEEHVRWLGVFSADELRALRDVIDRALAPAA